MRLSLRAVTILAASLVALPLVVVRTSTQAVSSEAAEVQLQLGDLLYEQGRFIEAFDAYEVAAKVADTRLRRRALAGKVRARLRMAEFATAYDDAKALIELSPRDPEAVTLHGDALWALGRFQDSEQRFEEALTLNPESSRARHGRARSLASRSQLDQALDEAQAALRLAPRDGEIHHTVGTIYERMRRYEEAANAYGSYVNLLPNKDRSVKAAWSRAEVEFLRAFKSRVPFEADPSVWKQLHTVPFRTVNEKVMVKAKVNKGSPMDFVLDTGSELTVITRDVASRLGVKAISETLSAGVGDFGLRGLQVGRIDTLTIGTLELRNVPCLIKNPPLRGLPTREAESFSPISLGLSMLIDYGRQELLIGSELPQEPYDYKLPLRVHRLAMVQGMVNDGPANFVVDTGGQVISISTDTASSLDRDQSVRQIPLKVYGTSGWDKDAFLLPGVHLAFHGIQYSNFPVVVLNLRAPSILLGFQLGGIVGHKFLSPYRAAIDLKTSEVRLKRLPGAAQASH
jgi:Flp pilus assembly protein TadD/predicted aspartyl protease